MAQPRQARWRLSWAPVDSRRGSCLGSLVQTIQTLLVVTAAVLLPVVPGQAQEFYRNHEHGFSVEFPQGWTVKGSSVASTIVKGVHRDSENRLVQIAIAKYELSDFGLSPGYGPIKGGDCFSLTKAIHSDGLNIRRVESGASRIASYRAEWCLMEADFETDSSEFSMTGRHYWFLREGYIYRVSVHTTNGLDYLNTKLATATQSISTLQFKD